VTAAAGRPLSLLALVGVALALGACRRNPTSAPSTEAMATAPLDVDSPAPASPSDDDPPEAALPAPSTGETVTIKLVADARRQAHVYWGRKDLGVAPLEISRPRGSGPLDVLVVAPGALPLHTRLFTDHSETLALRLYSDKEASGLLGWTAPEPPKNGPVDKKPRR
jgi:hypothetical protein